MIEIQHNMKKILLLLLPIISLTLIPYAHAQITHLEDEIVPTPFDISFMYEQIANLVSEIFGLKEQDRIINDKLDALKLRVTNNERFHNGLLPVGEEIGVVPWIKPRTDTQSNPNDSLMLNVTIPILYPIKYGITSDNVFLTVVNIETGESFKDSKSIPRDGYGFMNLYFLDSYNDKDFIYGNYTGEVKFNDNISYFEIEYKPQN